MPSRISSNSRPPRQEAERQLVLLHVKLLVRPCPPLISDNTVPPRTPALRGHLPTSCTAGHQLRSGTCVLSLRSGDAERRGTRPISEGRDPCTSHRFPFLVRNYSRVPVLLEA